MHPTAKGTHMPETQQLTIALTPSQAARLAAIVAETGVGAAQVASIALSDWLARQAITGPAVTQQPPTPESALNAVMGTIRPHGQGEAPFEVEYWDEEQEEPAVSSRCFDTADQAQAFGDILSHLVSFESITFDHGDSQ